MASIKSFFDKQKPRSTEPRFGEKVSPEILSQLFPIRNFSEEIRQSFATENHVELIDPGTTLFTIDTPTNCAIYLISGRVNFTGPNGRGYIIEAGSAQSKFPICSRAKHTGFIIGRQKYPKSCLIIGYQHYSPIISKITSQKSLLCPKLPESYAKLYRKTSISKRRSKSFNSTPLFQQN